MIDKINKFETIKWKQFELMLCLLQEYWKEQLEFSQSIEWYRNYTRFLAALKSRLTVWHEKDKWRPTLPQRIIQKIKEVKVIRNRYQKKRLEEDRKELRYKTREVNKLINKYRSDRWNAFLSSVQDNYINDTSGFWKHLSRIYRPTTLPFKKLAVNNKQLTAPKDIVDALYSYYKDTFSMQNIQPADEHTAHVEKEYEEILKQLAECKKKIKPTSVLEIQKIIKKLKPKKSVGVDFISNYMIKKLPPTYIECLCSCFNEWLSYSIFIDDWKAAKIVTLNKLKAGIPQCEQTRPISLLATHSKIYEKIILGRVQDWADSNNIVPNEQSGFRKGCLLQTRVLSIYQEVKNNLAGNIPLLGVYVDYKKAYDLVWHKALVVKLSRMSIPTEVLRILISWLGNRRAFVIFEKNTSDFFKTEIGLPQGSSLSPFIFIVYHADLVKCTGAFSTHLFADDLCTLIVPPIQKNYRDMLKFIDKTGTKICENLFEYSCRWKQPININKTVYQVFHTQVKKPQVEIRMNDSLLEPVRSFKYLGFTWTDKLSLNPTVEKCLENIEKSYSKLKWLKRNKDISTEVLRKCFFAYSFPFFTWLFPFFPLLPCTQKDKILRKYRVGLRIVHRCSFVEASDVLKYTKELPLEMYVCKYIQKRLANADKTDLGSSQFYEDPFHWNQFLKYKKDRGNKRSSLQVGHLFRLSRVNKMCENHESFIITWLSFVDNCCSKYASTFKPN